MAAVAMLFFFNPARYGFYPNCVFHSITGLDCPGCGSLRAIHELLHGNVAAAIRLNALFVASLPGSLLLTTRNRLWIFLALACVFTVIRNVI
jgi:hypothetical protein